jgi:hypothetical protein
LCYTKVRKSKYVTRNEGRRLVPRRTALGPLAHETQPRSSRVAHPEPPPPIQNTLSEPRSRLARSPPWSMHAVRARPAVRRRRPPRRLLPRPIALVDGDGFRLHHRRRRRQISPDEPRRSQAVEGEAWAARFVRAEVARHAFLSQKLSQYRLKRSSAPPYFALSSRHSWHRAHGMQQQCTIRSSHGSACGAARPFGR